MTDQEQTHHAVEVAPGAPLLLVAEDYQDAREMYVEYLRFSGFRVAEARNGLEALELTQALLPDLILMDLALPRMDGWEAIRCLKADTRTKDIPIVVLTAQSSVDHAERGRQVGCDAFLSKPCLPDELVSQIKGLLPQHAFVASETPPRSDRPGTAVDSSGR